MRGNQFLAQGFIIEFTVTNPSILELNMAVYTVFHEHPDHGKGRYLTQCITAREAVEEAKDKVPDEHAKNPSDAKELKSIKDKLTIRVFAGRHTTRPTTHAIASHLAKA